MTALTIILGILLMLGGLSCLFTPVAAFLATGYFVGVLFLVYGIAGLVKAFQRKSHALEVVISILAIAVGVLSVMRPGSALAFDRILLLLIAAWFIIQGIITLSVSLRLKAVKMRWVLGAVMGILGILLGIYSLIHPLAAAVTTSFLIGFYFLESGLNMIMLAAVADAVKKELRN